MPALAGVLTAVLACASCFCQQTTAAPQPEGERIFAQRCARCHGESGQGISAAITILGPSLEAEHNPGLVMAAEEIGPEHMPRFEYVLSVDQMRAVSGYVAQKLAVIPVGGGNVSDGGELYRSYCATCHRTAVRGGALGFVGTNAPALTSDSAALIAGTIRWGPGPMPSFPQAVLTDAQVDSIVKYIQVVQHPANPGGRAMDWIGPVIEGVAAWCAVLALILFCIWTEIGGRG